MPTPVVHLKVLRDNVPVCSFHTRLVEVFYEQTFNTTAGCTFPGTQIAIKSVDGDFFYILGTDPQQMATIAQDLTAAVFQTTGASLVIRVGSETQTFFGRSLQELSNVAFKRYPVTENRRKLYMELIGSRRYNMTIEDVDQWYARVEDKSVTALSFHHDALAGFLSE